MIGTISIKCNAANVNIPLQKTYTFINSPINIRVIDVPRKIGQWAITEIFVNFIQPDGSIKSKKCVLIGGCWVATVDGCSMSGFVKNGVSITANGKDESGNSVNGYVLGVGDLAVLLMDSTISPGQTNFYLHLVDEQPEEPRKGEVFNDGRDYLLFDGEDWKPFADVQSYLDDYYQKTEVDELFEDKADVSAVYDKEAVNGLLVDKADVSSVYTKSEVDEKIPTNVSELSNDSGYITSAALSPYATELYVDGEVTRVEQSLGNAINAIDGYLLTLDTKIPQQASETNKLADKDFVNSSITTATAFFKGTFNSVQELPTTNVTVNDYAFVIRVDSVGQTFYDRYKYTIVNGVGQWLFEYSINNTGFTAAQYASINSGITSRDVTQIVANQMAITNKADIADVYTKNQVYTQSETSALLDLTANYDDVYDKTTMDARWTILMGYINNKAGKTEVYLKSELSTLTLSGEYEDSTTFSFDLLYKI